jgi:hypothetical protein
VEGADDVGLDEVFRAVDGAVNVAFGREVHHRARPMLFEQPPEQRRVADVALHEAVPGVAGQRGQVLQVAGVGQGVQVDHRLVAQAQPVQHEVGCR